MPWRSRAAHRGVNHCGCSYSTARSGFMEGPVQWNAACVRWRGGMEGVCLTFLAARLQEGRMDALESFAAFAERLADAARAETLERWRTGCAAEGKAGAADFDPVTEADRGAERAMRALIEAEFPEHG